MPRYLVRAWIDYSIVVEAEDEEHALDAAYDIPFEAWEELDPEYDVEPEPKEPEEPTNPEAVTDRFDSVTGDDDV